MNLFSIQKNFNTKTKCIRHLEQVRWDGEPVCPHCENRQVYPRSGRKFYYHCNNCNRDFTVLYGTIFEGTKLSLPKWFMLIGMMLNARKGISAMEIHRHLGVTYKTAWYSAMRVRCAMVDQADMLEGIVEMDEAYIGGKPRKRNIRIPDNKAALSNLTLEKDKPKRGRGTKKIGVVGIVEREGKKRVSLEIPNRINGKEMLRLLRKYVNEEKAIMITDGANFYDKFDKEIQHLIINHKERYVDGIIHTNTIEGFWSIIKNGIRGEYHVLSKKYLPFYLAEFSYKYNRRSKEGKLTAFEDTIENAVSDDKCLVEYKPKGDVHEIAYGKKSREEMVSERLFELLRIENPTKNQEKETDYYYDLFMAYEEKAKNKRKQKKKSLYKDGGIIHCHKMLGYANELGITPNIKEHDSIAECSDCGYEFSYDSRKSNLQWECPECKALYYL